MWTISTKHHTSLSLSKGTFRFLEVSDFSFPYNLCFEDFCSKARLKAHEPGWHLRGCPRNSSGGGWSSAWTSLARDSGEKANLCLGPQGCLCLGEPACHSHLAAGGGGGWSPLTEGTRSPCSMMSRISLLLSDSEASSWCRSSPVERWVNPYFSTSFSHWVLLPEPGPPWDTPDKHLETTAFFWGTQKLFLLMDIHCVK